MTGGAPRPAAPAPPILLAMPGTPVREDPREPPRDAAAAGRRRRVRRAARLRAASRRPAAAASYLRELWRRREFASSCRAPPCGRSTSRRSSGSCGWSQPAAAGAVYFILVDILRRGRRSAYFAHLMAGCSPSTWSRAGRPGARSVVKGGRLILNTAFPRMLLPLSSVSTAFLRFLPTMIISSSCTWSPGCRWATHAVGDPAVALMSIFAAGWRCSSPPRRSTSATSRASCPTCCGSGCTSRRSSTTPTRCRDALQVAHLANPLGAAAGGWSDVLILGIAPSSDLLLAGAAWAFGRWSSACCSSSRGSASLPSASEIMLSAPASRAPRRVDPRRGPLGDLPDVARGGRR